MGRMSMLGVTLFGVILAVSYAQNGSLYSGYKSSEELLNRLNNGWQRQDFTETFFEKLRRGYPPLELQEAPVEGKWRKIPSAPIEMRAFHTAIWTGKEMIIWSGGTCAGSFANGASYNPETRRWKKLPKAPIEGRMNHTALWTGKEMIVWGGHGASGYLKCGASYDPRHVGGRSYLGHHSGEGKTTQRSGQGKR
jgi:hypothetical protein